MELNDANVFLVVGRLKVELFFLYFLHAASQPTYFLLIGLFLALALSASGLPYLDLHFFVLHSLLQVSNPNNIALLLFLQCCQLLLSFLSEVIVLDRQLHEFLIEPSVDLSDLAIRCSQLCILS